MDALERKMRREVLRYAVQRQMFCPYTEVLLDVRRAVLLDGSDHGKRMLIMSAAAYDAIKDVAQLWERLGGKDAYDVYDGRELFK